MALSLYPLSPPHLSVPVATHSKKGTYQTGLHVQQGLRQWSKWGSGGQRPRPHLGLAKIAEIPHPKPQAQKWGGPAQSRALPQTMALSSWNPSRAQRLRLSHRVYHCLMSSHEVLNVSPDLDPQNSKSDLIRSCSSWGTR